MQRITLGLLNVLLLTANGCQNKPAPDTAAAPQTSPAGQNAFTDHIDRGVTTMHKAEKARDATNANTQQVEQQSQKAGE